MYKINLEKNKEYSNVYKYTTKNEAGQILCLEITEYQTNKHNFYWVMFHIGKRKKGFQYMETTGKDGLKSLFWAKNCIIDFIDYIKNRLINYHITDSYLFKHTIVLTWDDNKRREAYYRGLKSLRFYYGVYDNRKVLMYNIK